MNTQFILKQPMKSGYCLACQGCCRFKEVNSPWRPKVYFKEEEILGGGVLTSDILDDKRCVKTKTVDGEHFCELLDTKTNKCIAYAVRPLECRLYPFIFVKQEGNVFLAVHLACPFVQEARDTKEFNSCCQELQTFFARKEVKNLLKENIAHIFSGHVLKDEIEILFSVCPS